MITKEDAKKKYGNSDPSIKNVFINWDAIDALPDELEVVFSEFFFDPKKLDEYFTNVGSDNKPSWYPNTDVFYKIADMCNIVGESEKKVEWIYEEVDINPLLCKSLDDEPTMRKIKTGARVTKQARVLTEDGTWRMCSPESNEFNFFALACIDFLTDEKYKNGNYKTKIDRQLRLKKLEKFAVQQAETKSFCKCIRVLAGLPTGFDTNDLKDGKLVFQKFIKSKRIQKLETAARIDAIRQGKTGELSQTADVLYGENQIEAPRPEIKEESFIEQETKPETKPDTKQALKTEHEMLRDIIIQYIKPGTANRKRLEKKSGAIDILEKTILNYNNEDILTLKDMVQRIEKIDGIKKIELDINDEEEGLF